MKHKNLKVDIDINLRQIRDSIDANRMTCLILDRNGKQLGLLHSTGFADFKPNKVDYPDMFCVVKWYRNVCVSNRQVLRDILTALKSKAVDYHKVLQWK